MNSNRQMTTAATYRKSAIAAGVLFLITHVTSVGAVILYDPILKNGSYILGASSETQVILGTFLDLILALAVVGTAVALYPVVKRWNDGIALGYVGLRTLEAAVIAVGAVSLLAAVTLRHFPATADADPATLIMLGSTLVTVYNWTFLLGPGLVCGTNTVLMAYLMYRSGLVPRFIPILGLVGGPLIFAYNTVKMFGLLAPMPEWTAFAVVPIFAWEITLAIWMITRGFRASATAAESAPMAATTVRSAA